MNIHELLNKDINCSCGHTHRCDIPVLEVGRGAINKLKELMPEKKNILLVADNNTYPAAGEKVRKILGDRVSAVCIYQREGHLVPDEESIEELRQYVTPEIDFILGTGSGVINDLCKYVSFYNNLQCGIVATAPSMDGFASSGAAMILKGMKVTVTTHAPYAIIGDTDILAQAPIDMIRSGYGDIIGKYSALNDWKLANVVTGEHFCQPIYDVVMNSTNEIRSLAGAISAREPEAVGALFESLVLIGACLTLMNTTRPGSGSEHHLSHFFEITGLIFGKPYFFHGTDVGYATVVTADLRHQLLKIEKPSFITDDREARIEKYKELFADRYTEVLALQDKMGRYEEDQEALYSVKWPEIKAVLAECPTPEEITQMLVDVGFDMSRFEEMYGKDKIRNAALYGKDLKDRYSVLWIYFFAR